MTWLPLNERWQVGAMLLSCGHIGWLIEPDGMTIDEMADMRMPHPCWQCRSRIGRRMVLPERYCYAVRPAFRTFRELHAAKIRQPRWR